MSSREAVLDLLRENARYSTDDIARMTDLSAEEVESTIAALEDDGVVRAYQAVVDTDKTEPEQVRASVELNVTSGDFDFAMEVEGDSMSEVSRFISEQVAPVPEITQTVTHYIMDTYKDRGVQFGDGHDDDRLSISP
jgi:DNA-binding Lrp family transcriptional regulator